MTQAAPRGGTPTRGRELRARGQQTLVRLLDAGARVFAERGYHAARVDDVVKAAETSHGTFYLYFSSKQDLFGSIAEGVAAEMLDLARELPSLDGDGDGRADAFREWLTRFHTLYGRHGDFVRTWTDAEIGDGELGQIAQDLVTEFSRQLAIRVRAAAPDLDARMTAFALVSMIERMSYYVQSRQLHVTPAAALDVLAAVTEAALHGAAAQDPTPVRGRAVVRS
jgi:AcrR family transcriptional regulator